MKDTDFKEGLDWIRDYNSPAQINLAIKWIEANAVDSEAKDLILDELVARKFEAQNKLK